MDRDTFGTEFLRRQRFVLQQHERTIAARAEYDLTVVPAEASEYLRGRMAKAKVKLADFENRLDAAIDLFATFVYDFITTHSPAHSPELPVSTSADENETLRRVGEREPSTENANDGL